MAKSTTISTWVPIVIKTLESYGIDSKGLLASLHVSEDQLHDPAHRFEDSLTHELMEKAVELSRDPGFGLKMIAYTNPQSFQVLGFALSSSNCLRDGFKRVQRFHRIVTSVVDIQLKEEPGLYRLEISEGEGTRDTPDVTFDFCLALFSYFISYRGKPEWRPLAVNFKRPAGEKEKQAYGSFFDCPVNFNCRGNSIEISSAIMEEVVYPMPDELAKGFEQTLEQQLKELEKNSLAEKVRKKIIELMPLGEPTAEQVASELAMSQRTMQRQLGEENTGYREIFDATREEMALQLLKQEQHSLTEIAYLLGFNDNSSFSRSFKRWTGKTPKQYRKT